MTQHANNTPVLRALQGIWDFFLNAFYEGEKVFLSVLQMGDILGKCILISERILFNVASSVVPLF